MSQTLFLASASPRRAEILSRQGIDFTILKSTLEEVTTQTKPDKVVRELAYQKALNVAENLPFESVEDYIIIAADTVVAVDGLVLGKPKDDDDAIRMLSRLQGRFHQVYTGVAVVYKRENQEKTVRFEECTKVKMYPMSPKEIMQYVATGEPGDKAGAYAIQGKCGIYIEKIDGDYNNVVGLPMARLYQECRKAGISLYD